MKEPKNLMHLFIQQTFIVLVLGILQGVNHSGCNWRSSCALAVRGLSSLSVALRRHSGCMAGVRLSLGHTENMIFVIIFLKWLYNDSEFKYL